MLSPLNGRRDFLKNLQSVCPYIIIFPNGSKTIASKSGTLNLSMDFILHNMLSILELKCN